MRILTLLLLGIVCVSCAKKQVRNDLTDKHLKGKVKSIVEIYYFEKDFALVQKEPHLKKILRNYQNIVSLYDENGNTTDIENIDYDSDSLQLITSFKYDNSGKKELQYNYDNWKVNSTITFEYDKDNNLVEGTEKYVDGKTFSTYKYDNNNLVEEKLMADSGKIRQTITYKYDNDNKITEKTIFKTDNVLYAISYYKYDNSGNLIEDDDSLAFGPQVRNMFEYSNFDKNGNWQIKIQHQYEHFIKDGQAEMQHKNATEYTRREIEYYQ